MRTCKRKEILCHQLIFGYWKNCCGQGHEVWHLWLRGKCLRKSSLYNCVCLISVRFKMTSAGSKTPVSILNEYLIRKGYIPKYDLVVNGCGTHNPTFAYVVECDLVHYKAMGKGRSKQEAKHEAAKKMLEYMNISCEDEYEEDVKQLVLPHENSVGYNAVGVLMDYCKKECYPEATYTPVDETGPPHAKVFTMKCNVSQLSTYGEARTKKQAKQIAAHKMVMQLQLESDEKPMAVAVPRDFASEEFLVPEYSKLTPVYQPQALLYKDFCNAYIALPEKSDTITGVLSGSITVVKQNSCQLVDKIAEELVVPILIERVDYRGCCTELDRSYLKQPEIIEENKKLLDLNSSKAGRVIIMLTLQLNPPIVTIENDLEEAAFSLLKYISILCV